MMDNGQRLSDGGFLGVGIFLTTLGVFAFIGNTLVLYVFYKQRLYRRPINLFILNLAISDLIVSFIGHPLSAISAFRREWLFGLSGCHAYAFICYTCACNCIMTHAIVSYFRYAIICKYRYVGKVGVSLVMKTLVCIWIYSLFWTVTPLLGWSSYGPEPYNVTCSITWYDPGLLNVSYVWCCFFFVLVVPLSIMVYSYIAIYKHTLKINKTSFSNGFSANISSKYLYELERGVTRICAVMTVVFMISWSPYAIISLAFALGYRFFNTAVLLPTFFAKCSCATNPIIYLTTHKNFREALINVFSCSKNKVGIAENREIIEFRNLPIRGVGDENLSNPCTIRRQRSFTERIFTIRGHLTTTV